MSKSPAITEFLRQMEEAETMLSQVALILATYYDSLVRNGIPEDLAKTLTIMQQQNMMNGTKQ